MPLALPIPPPRRHRRLVWRDDPGGLLLRTMLLPAVLLPLAIGFVRVAGERRGLYSLETGTAAFASILSAIFAALLWASASRLSAMAAITREAESALRASEAKFRAMFEQAPIGLGRVSFDDARWLDANDTFCRMLGYEREELCRTPWTAITHPEDVDGDLVPFRRMARGELERYSVEKRFVHKDGHLLWARLTLSLVRNEHGRPDYEIAVIEEITARKEAEEQLRIANARLQEQDRQKDQFLAMLSHELRNPLSPIRSSVDILEHASPGGPQAKRALGVIARQVHQMTVLIDDLLDVTRISRGKIRIQHEHVELCSLVRRTAEDHRSLFSRARVALEVATCRAPIHVQGDAARLGQIVGNLLTNAAKFTPQGGHVRVALEADGRTATLRVRDDGVGIPAHVLDRMFEPFVQAESTLERSRGGLGLGLALVKGLVELHGGNVVARSDGMNQGAELTVELPLAAGEDAVEPHRTPAEEPSLPYVIRVVVIEDNEDSAECLKEVLELRGHDVRTAATGQAGITLARSFHPDVVLCDLGLPGIDGFEVARRMRADPELSSAALVALSGYARPEDLDRSRDAGFDRHLAKPPDLRNLERTLQELARSPGG